MTWSDTHRVAVLAAEAAYVSAVAYLATTARVGPVDSEYVPHTRSREEYRDRLEAAAAKVQDTNEAVNAAIEEAEEEQAHQERLQGREPDTAAVGERERYEQAQRAKYDLRRLP